MKFTFSPPATPIKGKESRPDNLPFSISDLAEGRSSDLLLNKKGKGIGQ